MTRSGAPATSTAAFTAAVIDAPFGSVEVVVRDGRVASINLAASRRATDARAAELLEPFLDQLRRYFDDPRAGFDLPLADGLTPFARRVRAELVAIAPGDVLSYGELAARLGSSARAVGAACRHNPVPIVVPCHRVVARDGRGGFMGETGGDALEIKSWLLRHEQEHCPSAGRLL